MKLKKIVMVLGLVALMGSAMAVTPATPTHHMVDTKTSSLLSSKDIVVALKSGSTVEINGERSLAIQNGAFVVTRRSQATMILQQVGSDDDLARTIDNVRAKTVQTTPKHAQ